jgi:3-phosphoinositide dependent protein kinase-1
VPFKAETDYMTFSLIMNRELKFPELARISPEAINLIDKLLSLNPAERGADDYESLKNHPFFDGIDFMNLGTLDDILFN